MAVVSPYVSGWYADVFRRHELRFHDGLVWTEHVSDRGIPGIDTVPLAGGSSSQPPDRTAGVDAPPLASAERARVVPEFDGPEGDLLGAPLLVVDGQELAVDGPEGLDCAVRDQRGLPLGSVRVNRTGLGRKLLRLITSDTESEVSRVEVLDRAGSTVVSLHRPAHLMKPRITVRSGAGQVVGTIVPRQLFTRLCFTLEGASVSDGDASRVVGTVEGLGPSDRNLWVADHAGEVVARVSRTWEVLASTHHPEHGTFIVQVLRPLADPLRTLALAALLALETMLVPDADGS